MSARPEASYDPLADPDAARAAEVLRGLMRRLTALVGSDELTEPDMVGVMAIYNEVAYTVSCVDAFGDPAGSSEVDSLREFFYDNPALDCRILEQLLVLHCADPEAEAARLEYVNQLRRELARDQGNDDRTAELVATARESLARFDSGQRDLLERLGVKSSADSGAVFDKLVSATGSQAVRAKLLRARDALRDPRLPGIVDQIVALRRDGTGSGVPNALSETRIRLRSSAGDVAAFLHAYLAEAVSRASTGQGRTDPQPAGRPGVTTFELQECLQYAFDIAHAVFGITFRTSPGRTADLVVAVAEDSAAQELGTVVFDLWQAPHKTIAANHASGIRNRTDWGGVRQLPVAHVSCRFPHREGRLTFRNAHTLFHEFGHAVNHLLVRQRLSYLSGLEYLPPERREHLSMWFEKWVHHNAFAERFGHSDDLAADRSLDRAQARDKAVERGVLAFVDFDVHHSRRTLRQSYDALDERYGVSRFYAFEEIPAQFVQPRYLQHPGADFGYLWGAADSAAKFAAFRELSLDRIRGTPETAVMFAECFDFSLPTTVPDCSAAFEATAAVPAKGTQAWSL
ncbi:MAG: M3 family metallopeptidase [Kibdelosporangium sp.]